MKKNVFKCIIISLVCASVVFGFIKNYCDKTFLCSSETLSVAILDGESAEARQSYLDEQSYTYCRFLEMKIKLKNGEYDSFIESFTNYYVDHCSDDSRYAAFRSVFCDYETLSDKEIKVLLDALQFVYNYDIQHDILERNHLIQNNLTLQMEILYSSGHIIKAYEKKVFLDDYIENYRKIARQESSK